MNDIWCLRSALSYYEEDCERALKLKLEWDKIKKQTKQEHFIKWELPSVKIVKDFP